MSKVIIVEGKDIVQRTKMALRALAPCLPPKGSKILIKPNLVEPLSKNSGAVTRPEIIEGILQFLGNRFKIVVGEGAAIYETEKCFKKAEYYKILSKYNIRIVNLNRGPFVKVKLDGKVWKTIEIAEVAAESFIISVPILKEHSFGVTLGLKNMMGILKPKSGYPNKSYIHEKFAQKICDLVLVIKPCLTVVDATTAMYGSHLYGRLKRFDQTIVSKDVVACDLVGAKILGHEKISYLDLALKRKVGCIPKEVKKIRL